MPMHSMIRLGLMLMFVGVFAMPGLHAEAAGRTRFVRPDGDDGQAGSRASPWRTLSKASKAAEAGDTIVLLPGEYEGVLRPHHSGEHGSPITFRAAQRRRAKLVGLAEPDTPAQAHAVQIEGVSHIRIEGLHVQPQTPRKGRWLRIKNASHIRIDDCLMEQAVGRAGLGHMEPVYIEKSEQVQMRDSVLRQFIGSDMTHVFKSHHLLFEGNAIGMAGHSPLAFSPRIRLFKGVHDVVVRGNVFFATWGRPFEFFGAPRVLFEHNLIINAYHGRYSAGPEAKMMMEDSIVRFNRAFRNYGAPINLGYYNPKADAHQSRWYHNVIDANPGWGMRIETVENYIFKNNIFSRNDHHGGGRQLLLRSGANLGSFVRNVFWAGGRKTVLDDQGKPLTLQKVQSKAWQSDHKVAFRENVNTRPGYVDAQSANHALKPDSPLRDAGAHLTRATEAGEGKAVPVEDARWFFDGFGIEGEVGDRIAVGEAGRTARITRIDRDKNVLHLDRELTWDQGEPVGLPWAGEAPDIGAYEHGEGGRVSVQVKTPFVARPGESVRIEAVMRGGAKPASIAWHLGDGAVANGQRLTHAYEKPGGYPIRVRVTDQQGRTHRAAGFVDVKDPHRYQKPLVDVPYDVNPHEQAHPDFSGERGSWWWRCYKSRPSPDIEHDPEAGYRGAMHYIADEDEHPIPIRIWPEHWRIDRWPIVRFRYRVKSGVPMGVYVAAPAPIGETRRLYLAATPNAGIADDEQTDRLKRLRNDGQWHQVTLDVRAIREHYPETKVLDLLRFEAVNPEKIKKGEGYWLDELMIAPG